MTKTEAKVCGALILSDTSHLDQTHALRRRGKLPTCERPSTYFIINKSPSVDRTWLTQACGRHLARWRRMRQYVCDLKLSRLERDDVGPYVRAVYLPDRAIELLRQPTPEDRVKLIGHDDYDERPTFPGRFYPELNAWLVGLQGENAGLLILVKRARPTDGLPESLWVQVTPKSLQNGTP